MDALVIGAGPAGLMAAEELARAGRKVVICEGKSSPARKFLMAGKSGLNLTKDQDFSAFIKAYDCPDLVPMLAEFGPQEVMAWCRDLGQEVFTGSSGRVFPVTMKASPLLRAWLGRLDGLGVELRKRWKWVGFDEGFAFQALDSVQVLRPEVTILALGGASWARLGSDAAWVPWLSEIGVEVQGFRPANMGFCVEWSAHMGKFFGSAVKGVALCVGDRRERGEFVISSKGLEGGGIYAVSRELREGAELRLDLAPDVLEEVLADRLGRMKPAETLANRLRKLGLPAASVALVMEFGRGLTPLQAVKALPIRLLGPRPLDEAISVAGGVKFSSVGKGLELKALPRTFVCGEMLDWEAPTGGYLLTACLATGRWAGRAAARI
ncbi:MAG: NAD(P)/FAD-dependent oxidoreductase [Cypionkella sp.]